MADVLVVDDDPDIRSILAFLMVDEGHHVRVAADGEAGLRALEASSPDCLIVDMSENGVRLHCESEFPDDFTLVISDVARPRRSCRVVWRLGFEIGAKFLDEERLRAAG